MKQLLVIDRFTRLSRAPAQLPTGLFSKPISYYLRASYVVCPHKISKNTDQKSI